jgi:predicted enzyme related to lactoylglutathione lyase
VDETLETVEKNGGTIALPKMAIPGVGWLAYCKDTDGNMFGIMQPDPAAA